MFFIAIIVDVIINITINNGIISYMYLKCLSVIKLHLLVTVLHCWNLLLVGRNFCQLFLNLKMIFKQFPGFKSVYFVKEIMSVMHNIHGGCRLIYIKNSKVCHLLKAITSAANLYYYDYEAKHAFTLAQPIVAGSISV